MYEILGEKYLFSRLFLFFFIYNRFMMSKVYMLVGVPGSGKSTYARLLSEKHNIQIISSDMVRNEMPNLKEVDVFPEVYRRIRELIIEGKDLVYDATSISAKVRKRFFDNMEPIPRDSYEVEAHYFVPDFELSKNRIEKRNRNRNERYFPVSALEQFVKDFETPLMSEGFSKVVMVPNYEVEMKV